MDDQPSNTTCYLLFVCVHHNWLSPMRWILLLSHYKCHYVPWLCWVCHNFFPLIWVIFHKQKISLHSIDVASHQLLSTRSSLLRTTADVMNAVDCVFDGKWNMACLNLVLFKRRLCFTSFLYTSMLRFFFVFLATKHWCLDKRTEYSWLISR